MKIKIFLPLIFSIHAISAEYNFEKLLLLAQKNDIESEIEKTKIIELDAKINKLRADFYPNLSLVFGSEKTEARSQPEVSKNNFVGEFRLNYNLYRFGGTTDKIEALQYLKKQQEHNLKISSFKLRQNLQVEYNEALFFKIKLDILKNELKFNEQLKSQVAKKVKQGLVGNADILEIEMREATLSHRILETDEEYQHTLDSIRKITRLHHEDEIRLNGEIHHEHFSVKLDDLIKAAYLNNKKHLQTINSLKATENELASAKTDHLPEINLQGRYGKMRVDESYADDSLEGLVGIYVHIPLFSGGQTSANIDILKAKLANDKLLHNRSDHSLKINIVHLFEKMNNIHEQVDLMEKNYQRSINYFENVNKEYIRGVKNSLDLVSARDRMIDFKTSYSYTKKEFIKAKIKLEEATGVSFE